MQKPDQDPLAILQTFEKRLDARFRKRGIPRDDIEDLRQETFRRVLRFLKSHAVTNALPGLLAKTADCVVIDYLEAKNIEAAGISEWAEEEDETAPSDPEGELNDAQMKRHLEEVLANCDPRGRALLVARFYEGKTLKQVAEEMQIPLSTAHHLEKQAVKLVAFELREKRKISRTAVLPFLDESLPDDYGPPSSKPPSSAKRRSKSEPPAAFSAPKPPSTRPPVEQAFWPLVVGGALAAAAALLHFTTPERPPLAAHWPRYHAAFFWGNGALVTSPSNTQAGLVNVPGACVCSDPTTPPPPPPPPPSPPASKVRCPAPPEEEYNSMNRDLFHAFERAYARGDCETARSFRKLMTGQFAAAVDKWPPCQSK